MSAVTDVELQVAAFDLYTAVAGTKCGPPWIGAYALKLTGKEQSPMRVERVILSWKGKQTRQAASAIIQHRKEEQDA